MATVHYSGVGAGVHAEGADRGPARRRARGCSRTSRSLTTYGAEGEETESNARQDKGHATLLAGVLAACRGGGPLEPGLGAAYAAQSVALAALDSIAAARTVEVVAPAPRG